MYLGDDGVHELEDGVEAVEVGRDLRGVLAALRRRLPLHLHDEVEGGRRLLLVLPLRLLRLPPPLLPLLLPVTERGGLKREGDSRGEEPLSQGAELGVASGVLVGCAVVEVADGAVAVLGEAAGLGLAAGDGLAPLVRPVRGDVLRVVALHPDARVHPVLVQVVPHTVNLSPTASLPHPPKEDLGTLP